MSRPPELLSGARLSLASVLDLKPSTADTAAQLHETTPQVFLISRPSVDVDGMRGYLESVGGRGLLLIRTFMDEVRFNPVGNRITLVKRREPGRSGAVSHSQAVT